MSVETGNAVRITRVVRADPQTVWNAWTQAEQMKKWSCPAPGGAKAVSSDLRVGGAFEIRMEVEGNAHTAFGTYREVVAPSRLVYTWDWREEDNAMGDTLVTVEFTPVDEGTEVSIVHEGFPAQEAKAGHEEGWGACIGHFAALFD